MMFLALFAAVSAPAFSCTVIKVHDGDGPIFYRSGIKIRVAGLLTEPRGEFGDLACVQGALAARAFLHHKVALSPRQRVQGAPALQALSHRRLPGLVDGLDQLRAAVGMNIDHSHRLPQDGEDRVNAACRAGDHPEVIR